MDCSRPKGSLGIHSHTAAELPAHHGVQGQTQGLGLLSQVKCLVAKLWLANSADEQHLFTKWTLEKIDSRQPQLGTPSPSSQLLWKLLLWS